MSHNLAHTTHQDVWFGYSQPSARGLSISAARGMGVKCLEPLDKYVRGLVGAERGGIICQQRSQWYPMWNLQLCRFNTGMIDRFWYRLNKPATCVVCSNMVLRTATGCCITLDITPVLPSSGFFDARLVTHRHITDLHVMIYARSSRADVF